MTYHIRIQHAEFDFFYAREAYLKLKNDPDGFRRSSWVQDLQEATKRMEGAYARLKAVRQAARVHQGRLHLAAIQRGDMIEPSVDVRGDIVLALQDIVNDDIARYGDEDREIAINAGLSVVIGYLERIGYLRKTTPGVPKVPADPMLAAWGVLKTLGGGPPADGSGTSVAQLMELQAKHPESYGVLRTILWPES